jgi:hypothetical protein
MQKQFRQNKRYEKMVRKLPAILRHEDTAKKELSPHNAQTSRYTSKASLRSSGTSGTAKASRSSADRANTQEIKHIERTLIQK